MPSCTTHSLSNQPIMKVRRFSSDRDRRTDCRLCEKPKIWGTKCIDFSGGDGAMPLVKPVKSIHRMFQRKISKLSWSRRPQCFQALWRNLLKLKITQRAWKGAATGSATAFCWNYENHLSKSYYHK